MKNVIPEMDSKSMDIVADNISKLKELFPEAFTEGKVNFDALKEVLGDYIDGREERYSFTWNGKSKARMLAQTPSSGTLRPCEKESVDWDTTRNLLIEGDNLEVLKLLQKSYHKKLKMIYIDPPYNTGKDFVYKDNFKDNIRNYKEITGQVDGEGRNLSSNPETSGRYHTDWLNMMYPRLKIARNLLKDDGVIFISIGVEELDNLKKITDEIFGEENFVELFSWVKTSTPPALSTKSRKTNEYILCYERTKSSKKYNGEELDGGDQPLLNSGNSVRELCFPPKTISFKIPDGNYGPCLPDRVEIVNSFDVFNGVNSSEVKLRGEFKWTQDFLNEEIGKGTRFIVKSDKFSIRFLRDEDGFKRPTNFIKSKYIEPTISKPKNGVGTNENASSYLTNLMGGNYFDYPKPVSLIEYLINFIIEENDMVLDFFAGSGTTAEAVLKYSREKKIKLQFLLVQLPEPLKVQDASNANEKLKIEAACKFLDSIQKPRTIAELTKERIRRAAAKIKEENPDYQGDLGFKVFKLDSTNIKPWELDFDLTEQDLEDQISNIKYGRKDEDVLYEVLLKYGLDLTLPITEHNVTGHKVFDIGMGALMICLSDDITLAVVEGIVKLKEELNPEIMRVVFKDAGFADDVVKTNAVQILKQAGIEDVRSL